MPEPPSIWLIAGEASGDNYGAQLAGELLRRHPELRLKGMGAELMRQAGVETVVDSSELGVVGILEVIKHLPMFIGLFRRILAQICAERPQCVVLIDYPGFNLRLAKALRRHGIPVVYYISPQVWAWKKGRIPKIAATVSRMLCIFPFEPALYAGYEMPAEFVGHPLLQILSPLRQLAVPRRENLVLLLPGSRSGELKRLLPILLHTCALLHEERPELCFEMPLQRQKNLELAREILAREAKRLVLPEIKMSVGETRRRMLEGAAGIAASGTVSVEAVILGLPLVVFYKVNALTWQIGKRLVKLPYVSIANLVTDSCVFEECLQHEANPQRLAKALKDILPGGERRELVLEGMGKTLQELGGDSDVVGKVAAAVLGTKGSEWGGHEETPRGTKEH